MRLSGKAAQLIATKGPSRLRLSSWMKRAMTSFPTPDSPVRRMDISVFANREALSTSSFMRREREMTPDLSGCRLSTWGGG